MNRKLLNLIHTRRGLALISVLAMVTLATVIVLALFSVSDSEFKASKIYAGGSAARQFGDTAVNVVIGQLRSATVDSANPAAARVWASQPGALRVYNVDGSFFRGHKLYSDSTMIVSGSNGDSVMSGDAPDGNWDTTPDRYVDLNEPVVRAESGGVTRIFFPVVDPRASVDTPNAKKIEGFSYTASSPVTGSGGSINGVVVNGDADKLRLPMPVEWMYVLKDGSVGTMGGSGSWAGGGASPTVDNPIIGRVAFWTDDESSKINVNTASEPGYWAVPTFYHERDKGWVDSPPALNEYQRFPGHPATVALSTVLYPSSDPAKPTKFLDTYTNINDLVVKESIYDIVPKIAAGGSRDGTSVFVKDDVDGVTVEGRVKHDNLTSSVNILPPGGKSERLFASLDEFIFSQNVSGGKRVENNFTVTGITPSVLEKTRFFMTAHSRAPELNLYGRPRVAMWPVPDATLGETYRTGYDRAIAAVSTLSSNTGSRNTYYFSRKNANSALEDIGLDAGGAQGLMRNLTLMSYLDKLMTKTMPGGGSFSTKYGATGGQADYRQILVEVFDYIRTTNIYDSFLAPKFVLTEGAAPNTNNEMDKGGMDYRWEPSPPNKTGETNSPKEVEPGVSTEDFKLTELATAIRGDELREKKMYRTYTAPRFKVTKFGWHDTKTTVDLQNEIVASGAYPGHGQVTPAEWQIEGQTYKGFGRFPTLSEVGLHFICTGDGLNDAGSYRLKNAGPFVQGEGNKPGVSGGRTAERVNPDKENARELERARAGNQDVKAYWYSNYPPKPTVATMTNVYGCTFVPARSRPRGDDTDPTTHPGCQAQNWNVTLREGVPLTKDQKRIQVALLLEFFIPAVGYTKYSPEWTLVLDAEGLNGIKVKDVITGKEEAVFSTTENQVLKSNLNFGGTVNGLGEVLGIYPIGGTTSPQATTRGRKVKAVGGMAEDVGYDNSATDQSGIGQHGQLYNYPLVGSFVTVDRIQNIQFVVEKPLISKIYDDHDWQKHAKNPVQTIELEFPKNGAAPPPELARYSIEKRREETYVQAAVEAPRWWAFNSNGALNRWTGTIRTDATTGAFTGWNVTPSNADARTFGRFAGLSRGSVPIRGDTDPGLKSAIGGSGGNLPVSTLIYGYAPAGGYNGVLSRPQDRTRDNIDYYKPSTDLTKPGEYKYFGTDSVRSILPKYGDYRLVAARKTVPGKMWSPHPLYSSDSFFAHNFSSFFSDTEAGFYRGGANDSSKAIDVRLVPNTTYPDRFMPDTPQTTASSNASSRYGDFDNGPGNTKDGAYINKPDEGNLSVIRLWYPLTTDGGERYYRNAYFHDQWMQLPAREAFFTPNRMISSPGMFGSLPTGVFGSQKRDTDASIVGQAWRTLLFRPYTASGGAGAAGGIHPGAPSAIGGVSPADHYIMDLFWMPVVGPYAISDSWSTAGKINMNFQIVPFTYINRATAMYAAMKGELITAIPKEDATITNVAQRKGGALTKSYKQYKDEIIWPPLFFGEKDKKYWHRYIDLATTTRLMKARMDMDAALPAASKGLFRTASQICECHLVPQTIADAKFNPGVMTTQNATNTMSKFWQDHAITGDNTRERPYANLYQKLTTRSNSFRVFYRAQALKKARSIDPATVRTDSTGGKSTDTIVAEYRGSALIERYLDLTATLPDYGAGTQDPLSLPSLENYYRYRVLESKQFAP